MKKVIRILSLLMLFVVLSCVTGGGDVERKSDLPVDPAVTIGTLDNGLTYYIRQNDNKENRTDLWLVVKAGSAQEDDDQQGLAHFTEHMAFNGTDNFPKHEIINYLESIGMQFGPEINAYTSFDETVYMLQVPMEDPESLDTGLKILSEWAGKVSFDTEEIEKERGVVIEEWRLGRGPNARMMDLHFPVFFNGSKYGERLPIGKKEILDSFEDEEVLRFYDDWYRPDLMAVIVVGNINPEEMEEKIIENFSSLENPENPRPLEEIEVPFHEDVKITIASDPEAQYIYFESYIKYQNFEVYDEASYRKRINHFLITEIANQRLTVLTETPGSPVYYAYINDDSFNKGMRTLYLVWVPDENRIMEANQLIMEEVERIKRYGFSDEELELAKKSLFSIFKKTYNERETMDSSYFLQKYMYNFLVGLELTAIEWKYEYIQVLLEEIGLEEVQEAVRILLSDENEVLMVSAPENTADKLPGAAEILEQRAMIQSAAVEEAEAIDISAPLLAEIPEKGSIVSEKELTEIDAVEWTLSNGIKVILKPTDFKSDEIVFDSFSTGGTSLVSDKDYMSSLVAVELALAGGLGTYDSVGLEKKLTGVNAYVSPYIAGLTEGISGASTIEDLETAFQLIYLNVLNPRIDNKAVDYYIERLNAIYENREADPGTVFSDTYGYLLRNKHFRTRAVTKELIAEINPDRAIEIYQERFADADDFVFVFVGNLDLDVMRDYAETYLASLPGKPETENWTNREIDYFKGVQSEAVYKGEEEKSVVALSIAGEYEWDEMTVYYLDSLEDVLRIKLREVIREEESGSYGVQIRISHSRYPDEEYSIQISFGCDPERTEELSAKVLEILEEIKVDINDETILKVTVTQRQAFEKAQTENSFWVSSIRSAYFFEDDVNDITAYPDKIDTLTEEKLLEVANEFIRMDNFLKVILYPESYK